MMLAEASKLTKQQREQGLRDEDIKTVQDRIRVDLQPLQNTLAWQGGGIETYKNYADSAEKIAVMMMQKGMSAKDASAKAVEALVGFKYHFSEGTWFGIGRTWESFNTYRVPKSAVANDEDLANIRWGAIGWQYDIGAERPIVGPKDEHAPKQQQPLAIPATPAGVRPEDAEKQWRETIRANGFWVTSPGDGGLTLYVKSGLGAQPVLDAVGMPIKKTWEELRALGSSVKAATMRDVYKPGVRMP